MVPSHGDPESDIAVYHTHSQSFLYMVCSRVKGLWTTRVYPFYVVGGPAILGTRISLNSPNVNGEATTVRQTTLQGTSATTHSSTALVI